MKLKLNRIVFAPSERHKAMIRDLMETQGFKTVTSTLEYCLITAYESTLPSYLRTKVKSKVSGIEAERDRQDEREKEQVNLCVMLGGTVSEKNGQKVCSYYTYDNVDRYEMAVPLESLHEGLLEGQYMPSKAKVERLQRQKKTSYKP